VPAAFGAGAPGSGCALGKFAGVIGVAELTTRYRLTVPHSRSSPGALKVSVAPLRTAPYGTPGRIASRP